MFEPETAQNFRVHDTGADPAVQVRITALYQYIGLKLNAGKERFLPGMSAVRNFFLTVIVFTEEAGMI